MFSGDQKSHMRTASSLVFTFIKEGLKTKKVKSTAIASKKIKTNHHRAFSTHQLLSHPYFICDQNLTINACSLFRKLYITSPEGSQNRHLIT